MTTCFLKHSATGTGEDLAAEAEGLQAIARHLSRGNIHELKVPAIINQSRTELQLENIQCTCPSENQWQQLGRGLAKLHNLQFSDFGWASDNFIGRSTQRNGFSKDWGQFFLTCRLQPQIEAMQNRLIRQDFLQQLDANRLKLVAFLNKEVSHPSLLHGDLWHGNVLFSQDRVWLIDPAVYYGDAEADIAMTEFFGGFSAAFYQSYGQLRPLSHSYPLKSRIYNLYHSLNHYNLFGDSYLCLCHRGLDALKEL